MGFALSDIQIKSSAFSAGNTIPSRYTGEGINVSPPLAWTNVPNNTKSLAIVCHDPDAPLVTASQYGYVHWVLYGIPSDVRILGEDNSLYVPGKNDFGNTNYGGPMPPAGHGNHNYYYWILALSRQPNLPAGLTMIELFRKIESDVVGMNRLIGVYRRS